MAATLFAHDSVAFEDRIRDFHDSVLFDEYDLAEYGGRMFDKFEDAPETLLLVLWYQAERVAGPPLEVIPDSNEDQVGRSAAAQREGKVSRTYPAVALLGLARSTAMIWHTRYPNSLRCSHPIVATGETWSSV